MRMKGLALALARGCILDSTVFIWYNASMDTEVKKITILVPAAIVEAMKRLAEQERRSMNQEMIRAFEDHLKQHQPKEAK